MSVLPPGRIIEYLALAADDGEGEYYSSCLDAVLLLNVLIDGNELVPQKGSGVTERVQESPEIVWGRGVLYNIPITKHVFFLDGETGFLKRYSFPEKFHEMVFTYRIKRPNGKTGRNCVLKVIQATYSRSIDGAGEGPNTPEVDQP